MLLRLACSQRLLNQHFVPTQYPAAMYTFPWILLFTKFLLPFSYALSKDHALNLPDTVVIEEKLLEELPSGHIILNLNKAVTLHDTRHNASQHRFASESRIFTLIPAEQHEYFRVSPNHDLVVVKRIDRETICGTVEQDECLLRLQFNALQMVDHNSRTLLRTVFVRFLLVDTNDNRPICQPPSTALKDDQHSIPTIEVSEDAHLNEVLASWTVIDADTPKHGIYGFRQLSTSPIDYAGDQFSLDLSEATLTQRPWSKVTLQLRLNRPFKKQPSMNSRSSRLLGEYLIKYAVWDSSDEPSDYSSSHRTVCHLRVHVLDINNHHPEWISPQEFKFNQPVRVDLKEGTVGSMGRNNHILKLEATDGDIGPNARIQYHMMMDTDKSLEVESLLNNLLHLDPRTGVLRLRRYPIDYEAISRQLPLKQVSSNGNEGAGIRFFVKAVDSPKDESQQRSSSVGEVVLYIHDINDAHPKITVLPISLMPSFSPGGKKTLSVRENLPALEPVATVSVEDPDTGSGGRVECDLIEVSLKNGSTPNFRLIKTTFPEWTTKQSNMGYQILTAGPLDREAQSSHDLRLICIDSEGATDPNEVRLTSVVNIFVRVLDENDCSPTASPIENEFLSDGTTVACKVVENVNQGMKICQIKAVDSDEGENAMVEWTAGNDMPSWLKVDADSGWLVASGPGGPDREMAERHNFSVIATDGRRGKTRLSTTVPVSLEVTDVNDHAPEIGSFFYFAISESAPPGTFIGRLNATDRDKTGTDNAALTYTIARMRPYDPNRISSSEVDEKPGVWSYPNAGSQKSKIPVVLDDETGEISVGPHGLDREQLESFELLVEVIDGGKRQVIKSGFTHQQQWNQMVSRLTAQTIVQINVQDENDNVPKFIFPKSDAVGKVSLTCRDIQHLPRVVLQVVANDSDKGPNSELEYSLYFDNDTQLLTSNRKHEDNRTTPVSDAPWFEVDPRSGEISLVAADELLSRCETIEQHSRRDLGRYDLIVSATDKGEPRLSATASVQVRFITSDQENMEEANLVASNFVGRGLPGFTSSVSTAEAASSSRFEAIISSEDDRQHWIHEGGDEPTSFEIAEPRSADRIAIFSSPIAFWAATICLAVATTILLGLICTFVLIAFRRRGKQSVDGDRQPPSSLYSEAKGAAGAPRSACMSIDASTMPSCDPKGFRLAPYPEHTATKKKHNTLTNPCHLLSSSDLKGQHQCALVNETVSVMSRQVDWTERQGQMVSGEQLQGH
ncbi:Protocadherin-11 X-linked [Echinococcus granulosus]|nr:Protocadherin-11 X-linked [Echinococcus granulosus]